MSKLSLKKEQPPAKPKLINWSIDSSQWITNFWFIDQFLYVTDAQFNSQPKLLGRLDARDIVANISKKGLLNTDFVKHPNPINSSFLEASRTSIEPLDYLEAYLYNLVKFEEKFYLSLIKTDRSGSYVLEFDQDWTQPNQIELFNDYVLIGCFEEKLVFKSFQTKIAYKLLDNQFVSFPIQNVNQILQLKNTHILTTDDYKLYFYHQLQQEFILIRDFETEITIANFDATSFLLSSKKDKATYYVNGDQYDNFNWLTDSYFYRLAAFQKKLLVGKPLYLDDQVIDYDLPLAFIK